MISDKRLTEEKRNEIKQALIDSYFNLTKKLARINKEIEDLQKGVKMN